MLKGKAWLCLSFVISVRCQNEPIIKPLIEAMLKHSGDQATLLDYLHENVTFVTNFSDDPITMGNGTGIRDWYEKVLLSIPQAFERQARNELIFVADNHSASLHTYIIGKWTRGPFMWIQASSKLPKKPFKINLH